MKLRTTGVESVEKSTRTRHQKKNYGLSAAHACCGSMQTVLGSILVKFLKFLFAIAVCLLEIFVLCSCVLWSSFCNN